MARQDAWNFSCMEQLVSVDNRSSAASVRSDMGELVTAAAQSPSGHYQKKSAQAFLGDNANLVNLDNLLSFPSSSPSREFCTASCYKLVCFAVDIAHSCQFKGCFRQLWVSFLLSPWKTFSPFHHRYLKEETRLFLHQLCDANTNLSSVLHKDWVDFHESVAVRFWPTT